MIHVVGPNRTAGQTDRSLLTSCYARALAVADELGARSVAFPLVSAGIYGWPQDDADRGRRRDAAGHPHEVEEARLVAFGRATYDEIRAALADREAAAGFAMKSVTRVIRALRAARPRSRCTR